MGQLGAHGVTDLHIHVQPWDMLKPAVARVLGAGRADRDLIDACTDDPGRLLAHLDAEKIDRAALIKYLESL